MSKKFIIVIMTILIPVAVCAEDNFQGNRKQERKSKIGIMSGEKGSPYDIKEIIVKFESGGDKREIIERVLDPSEITKIRPAYNLDGDINPETKRNFNLKDVVVIEVDVASKAEFDEKIENLNKHPKVEYAQPNNHFYVNNAPQFFPQDPYFEKQWGLHNTGIHPSNGLPWGTEDADIDAPEAWYIEKGSDEVVVAVIDTGVDYNHPDLADNMWINEDEIPNNQIDDDDNGYIDDYIGYDFCTSGDCSDPGHDPTDPNDPYGHGTHCAGIIAAVSDNVITEPRFEEGDFIKPAEITHGVNYSGIDVDLDNQYAFMTSDDNKAVFRGEVEKDYDLLEDIYYYNLSNITVLYDAPSPQPRGVALRDNRIWIADASLDQIYKVGASATPISIQKVKLNVTKLYEGSYPTLRICELELYNTNVSSENLALGGVATASSGSGPEYVNDGDGYSFWSTKVEPSWIQIDLGQMTDINKIVIKSQLWRIPVDYTIDVFDGVQWITLFEVTNNEEIEMTHLNNEQIFIEEQFNSPGPDPKGLHWDGTHFWNIDGATNKIYKLSSDGQIVDSFDAPGSKSWGVLSGDDSILVSEESTHKTYRLDFSGNIIDEFDAGIVQFWGYSSIAKARGLAWCDDLQEYFFSIDIWEDVEPNNSLIGCIAGKDSMEFIDKGVAGVCHNCKIMAIKGFNSEGWGTEEDLANALIYAADNGAHIISNSWGSSISSEHMKNALEYASVSSIIVASAGNSNSDWMKLYPAAYSNVISVAATDHNDQKALFSNYGSRTYDDFWVDVSAPGDTIYSTLPTGVSVLTTVGFKNDYDYMSGTSMACPFVSGLLGLVQSYNFVLPEWDNNKIMGQILQKSDDIDTVNPNHEGLLGTGRINAYRALTEDPKPFIILRKYDIDDAKINSSTPPALKRKRGPNLQESKFPALEGNRNGLLDPGETVSVKITIRNLGDNMDMLSASLISTDPDIKIYPFSQKYDNLNTMEDRTREFIISLAESASMNQVIDFELFVSAGNTFNQTIPLKIKVPYSVQKGWPVVSEYMWPFSSPVLGNIDENNDLEIFFGNYDPFIYAYYSDGRAVDGWPVEIEETYAANTAPALADIDNDDKVEVFAAAYSLTLKKTKIIGLDDDGTSLAGWPVNDLYGIDPRSPSIGDIDNDGDFEIIVSGSLDDYGYVYIWHHDGTLVNEFGPKIIDEEDHLRHPPALADIDNDGDLEIFTVGEKIYGWHHDGADVNGFPAETTTPGVITNHGPVLGDINNDGIIELIAAIQSRLYVFRLSDASLLWTKDFGPLASCHSLVLADVNENGHLEIIATTHNEQDGNNEFDRLHVFDFNGNELSGWPAEEESIVGVIWGYYPVVGDIDGDNEQEIILLKNQDLYAFNGDGTIVENFPLHNVDSNNLLLSAALGDLEGDGDIEIILGGDRAFVYDGIVDSGNTSPAWPMIDHDSQHTGVYK